VATILGDYMEDIVIVGGLVPSLLIDQNSLPEAAEQHVGTIDLDVGLTLSILEDKRYEAIAERLRRAGFSQDISDQGNPTRQRWKITEPGKVTMDFLIPPVSEEEEGGKIRNYGEGIQDVAKALKQILQEKETKRAMQILNKDFTEHDGVGAVRVAQFITGGRDDGIQADVIGFVRQLIDLCG
jgi:hypothetical protein